MPEVTNFDNIAKALFTRFNPNLSIFDHLDAFNQLNSRERMIYFKITLSLRNLVHSELFLYTEPRFKIDQITQLFKND